MKINIIIYHLIEKGIQNLDASDIKTNFIDNQVIEVKVLKKKDKSSKINEESIYIKQKSKKDSKISSSIPELDDYQNQSITNNKILQKTCLKEEEISSNYLIMICPQANLRKKKNLKLTFLFNKYNFINIEK